MVSPGTPQVGLGQLVSALNPPNPLAAALLTQALQRRALEKEGWSVAEAENGRVGLERLAERVPALILLDLMMPVMDGFEFVVEARKNEAWRSVPIVVVTAKDLSERSEERRVGI